MSVLKEILDSVPVAFIRRVAEKSLRYIWMRTGRVRLGAWRRLPTRSTPVTAAFLPRGLRIECMDDYKKAFGEKAEDSMVDLAVVEAQPALVGLNWWTGAG